MALRWLASFLEKDNVSRTSRDTRCLSVLLNRSMWLVLRANLLMALCCAAGITLLIHHILIRVKRGVLTVGLWNLLPQVLGTRVATIAYVKGNNLAGLNIHGDPHPLLIGYLLHKAGHFIGFYCKARDQDIVLTGDRLDMQMIRQRVKALDQKAQ